MKFQIDCIAPSVAAFALIVVSVFYFAVLRTRDEEPDIHLTRIENVPRERWRTLAGMKVFFGHQSVGRNIIDGMVEVGAEHDFVDLNIRATSEPADFDGPLFAHSPVGETRKPSSKVNHFREIIDSGIGGKADIAFFKFCYVDMTRDSNPGKLFSEYRAVVDELVKRYPDTRFLHVTVPLRSPPEKRGGKGKSFFKSFLGRGEEWLDDNRQRQHFNELLVNAYGTRRNVFDLALIESTEPDGHRYSRKKGGRDVYFLAPDYTYDGGHLNEEGRKWVAEQLLIFLAGCAGEVTPVDRG